MIVPHTVVSRVLPTTVLVILSPNITQREPSLEVTRLCIEYENRIGMVFPFDSPFTPQHPLMHEAFPILQHYRSCSDVPLFSHTVWIAAVVLERGALPCLIHQCPRTTLRRRNSSVPFASLAPLAPLTPPPLTFIFATRASLPDAPTSSPTPRVVPTLLQNQDHTVYIRL